MKKSKCINTIRGFLSVLLVITISSSAIIFASAAKFTPFAGICPNILNVSGTSVSNGSVVKTWEPTGHWTQNWTYRQGYTSGTQALVLSANTAYAINRSTSTGQAIMWYYDNGYYDSDLKVVGSSPYIKFKLARTTNSESTTQYLLVNSVYEGAYVWFSTNLNYNSFNYCWEKN